MDYIEKIEGLLNAAEAAFDLTQDELTDPGHVEGLWQRATYRLSLAQGYIGLMQVQNIGSVTSSVEKMANAVEKENN